MKVCLVPICYNSHSDALSLLDSIESAYGACSGLELEVVLCDNSTVPSLFDISLQAYSYSFKYFKSDNIGYFPAFNNSLSKLSSKIECYDYVVVCNVDLEIAEDFFSVLQSTMLSSDIGLVAPGIFSGNDGRDLNPKIMRRPSLLKTNFMRIICSSPYVFFWYRKLARLREIRRSRLQARVRSSVVSDATVNDECMYGAHGSFMVFTKSYFVKGGSVNYPRFLFGEECFVAEQLLEHGLKIKHLRSLRVFDKEHASTSREGLAFICSEHKKSYDFFYDQYLKKKN
ncbi:glycosyltransferase family 2 protein [Ectopseudomonas mendocina]|uniref:glycosyltransferase family 2 protein n=1 Tax=Ectopseudomonas mendocina TaxID=300 RepID=UPI0023ECCF07|nr:glycosyltransferase [Pseudomonas mendocina]